ncbi:TOMM precursor leader peptide-binding protein [Actinomadura rudentiformis]|uniref:TOMM leader peptide-binding protein n=2 Tax=Actinomadura rudentiformis TaxID=359158 RepID=A0A6H9YMN9_9ACTN|nr:TOMM precursor leader peptide-binding protein [Actinomadura rudentiformis]
MLAPHLTGRNTVAELTGGLNEAQRTMVVDFVRTLLERGFARDSRPAGPADPAVLPDRVLERFQPQLNYVEHYVDDAQGRFIRFRDADVLVFGRGGIAMAAALSLLRNGMRTVHVTATEAEAAALREEATALTALGCEAEIRLRTGDAPELDPASYDLVIAAVEGAGAADALRLASAPPARGIVLPATVIGTRLTVGPLVRPGTTPCWTCSLLRLDDNLDPASMAALWRGIGLPGLGAGTARPSAPVAAMFGTMLGYEAFRTLTGCLPAETEGAVILQDQLTLETSREPVLPHPRCPSCGDPQRKIIEDAHTRTRRTTAEELEPADPEEAGDPDEASESTEHAEPAGSTEPAKPAAAAGVVVAPEQLRDELTTILELVSEHAGVFTVFDDTSIDQSPLKVTRLRAGSTASPGSPPRSIAAADLHYVTRARTRAVHAAALAYVGRAGPGSIPEAGADARPGLASVSFDRLLTWSGRSVDDDQAGPWLTARSLLDGREFGVPTGAVHPFSAANAELYAEPTAAGAGAGATAAEAIRQGLLSALAYAALRTAAGDPAVARTITLDAAPHGSEIDFLVRTTRNLEHPAELIDLAPDGPAHLVLARATGSDLEPVPWSVGAALSRDEAVTIALRDLIACEQLRRELGETAEVDFGDPVFPSLDVRAIRSPGPASARPGSTTVAAILDDLRARDLDALVVPTATADLVRHGHVVTVRVLMATSRGSRG